MTDFDSPWKEVLDGYFPAFLAFFFPEVYNRVDWSRAYESLDTELQQVVRDAELGRRSVDKLFKVWRLGGGEAWILIHAEVQNQAEAGFPRRMFVYHYRSFDRFDRELISLAVLGDDNPNWRPHSFGYDRCGCKLVFEFPIAKLLDYATDETNLEANTNPFAVVVLAHLKTRETARDNESRRTWKTRLVKGLYARGLSGDDIRNLFRFIDWLMELPEKLELKFWNEVQAFEEEQKMPYVTSVERIGIKKGLEQGLEQGRQEGRQVGRQEGQREGLLRGIEMALDLRFGGDGLLLMPEINAVSRVESLEVILGAIKTAQTVDDVRRLIG